MELKKIFQELLDEQTGSYVVSIPKYNIAVSLFPAQKKIILSPQNFKGITSKIRTYVHLFKQEFNVKNVKFFNNGSFSIVFDPREDFQQVAKFVVALQKI